MRVRLLQLLAVTALAIAACTSAPPDRRPEVDELTRQLGAMPGVVAASNTFSDNAARGPAYFEIDVDVRDDITGDQVDAITSRFLDDLRAVDYAGYHTELDVHRAENLFLVDASGAPVSNSDQILAQARSWVALRQRLPGSTVRLRAAVSHDARTVPNSGTIELAESSDYTAVAAAVDTLATSFADLSAGEWTISAGKQHPAEIRTSKRLPNPAEMNLWTTLNADQSIPHADVFTVNGPVTGPFFVSERIPADDPDTAVRLAQQHLPIVAQLPAPVVYTATNQYRGHIGYRGQATAPVMITIGGCTARTYRLSPAEQALIDRYENCHRPPPR